MLDATTSSELGLRGDPYLLALTCKTSLPTRTCRQPRTIISARTGEPVRKPCGRPRCSLECRDVWARKMATCLRRSFRQLPPTHELRVTVLGLISDRGLSLALGRFLRRLRGRLGRLGSGCQYFAVNEWADGHRHTHVIIRTAAELTPQLVGALWRKTLPGMPVTYHCAPVCNPAGFAN